ncbi:hypothetical protein ACE13N_004856 [Escherichia coli O45:H11]|uniref:hypothetical protein n=1 Tax=Escherichia coli TaxID=562 RepID=UPI000BDE8DCD|nr:hypothetical protein [Escherichia coli]EFN6764998.1 hypothetical protein [Escherichia coli O45:H11]EFK1044260.1 hypothetical protein [Escherichia coli]EHB7682259.1 hypothetical protein [Escherichia coli]EHK0758077.1 hypothetical protein [Escherichia coli]EIP3815630.1 hypothetical protein [Escherichia coli]
MANPYGVKFAPVNASNDLVRCKIIAYSGDPLLQDRLITLAAPLTEDVIVGDLLKADGTKATAAADIAYVAVEPSFAGQESVVVAHPTFVILARAGIEFNGMAEESVISKLQSIGFVIAGYSEAAIPTT